MKKMILGLLLTFSLNSQATIDSNSNVYILAQEIQSEEYFVQIAPIIGCVGLPKGPELAQLTASYEVSNLGCGMSSKENINVLTCAKVVDFQESTDFSTFSKITLDISACADKNNVDFLNGVKKVVKLNFATKTVKNPELILKK